MQNLRPVVFLLQLNFGSVQNVRKDPGFQKKKTVCISGKGEFLHVFVTSCRLCCVELWLSLSFDN